MVRIWDIFKIGDEFLSFYPFPFRIVTCMDHIGNRSQGNTMLASTARAVAMGRLGCVSCEVAIAAWKYVNIEG